LTRLPFEVFAFIRLPPNRLLDQAIPSWALLSVQRRLRSAGITSMWLGDPAMPLAVRPGYAVFPCRPPLANNFTRYAVKPLIRFRRPPGLSRMTASHDLSITAPSLGFAPSWHIRSQKVRFPQAFLPATFRPQGFLPPSRRLAPFRALLTLFQINSTFRVFPSEPSPRRG
jgi:hypothetical protein